MTGPADSDLFQELNQLVLNHDRTPTMALMARHGKHPPETSIDRFGSWEAALHEAVFNPARRESNPNRLLEKVDSETANTIRNHLDSNNPMEFFQGKLLLKLLRLAEDLGKTPSSPEMDNYGQYSASAYKDHFGSWDDACNQAGL